MPAAAGRPDAGRTSCAGPSRRRRSTAPGAPPRQPAPRHGPLAPPHCIRPPACAMAQPACPNVMRTSGNMMARAAVTTPTTFVRHRMATASSSKPTTPNTTRPSVGPSSAYRRSGGVLKWFRSALAGTTSEASSAHCASTPSHRGPRRASLCGAGKADAEQHDVDDDRGKVVPARQCADGEAIRDVEEGQQVGPDADEPQRGQRQPDGQVAPHALSPPPQPVEHARAALGLLRGDDLEALRAGGFEGLGGQARVQVIAAAREPSEHRVVGRDKLDHRGVARQVGRQVDARPATARVR